MLLDRPIPKVAQAFKAVVKIKLYSAGLSYEFVYIHTFSVPYDVNMCIKIYT